MRVARFGLLCVLVALSSAEQLDLGSNQSSVPKLDAIMETMHDLKTLALTDLHELEEQDHHDRVEIAGISSDLEVERSQLEDEHTQAQQLLNELDNLVLVHLIADMEFSQEQVKTIDQELTQGEAQFNITHSAAKHALAVLSDDFNTANQLIQQLGEVMHRADNMEATAKKYMELVSRKQFDDLPATCESRDELSNALNTLLQHLEEQRREELGSMKAMEAEHAAFVDRLADDRAEVAKSIASSEKQQESAQSKRKAATETIHQLEGKIAQVQKKLDSLKAMRKWNEDTFASRYDILSRTIHTANQILQESTLLQAKIEIRTVSTT